LCLREKKKLFRDENVSSENWRDFSLEQISFPYLICDGSAGRQPCAIRGIERFGPKRMAQFVSFA
jgi:hypothetical protein